MKSGEAREVLRDACKNAEGNCDIIVIPLHEDEDFQRIVRALDALKIFWCLVDQKILVNRHELEALGAI